MRIPLYIDFNGRNVLVIGGGSVGTRRAKKFLNAGAKVKILSLDFSEELVKMSKVKPVELVRIDVAKADIEQYIRWADLVVIATDDMWLNEKITVQARKLNKLVNNATNAATSDVIVPFEVEVDGIRVAVTTEGKAGMIARIASEKIKKLLEADNELRCLMRVLSKVKTYMKSHIKDPKVRLPLYFEIIDNLKFRDLIRKGDIVGAYKVALEIIGLNSRF